MDYDMANPVLSLLWGANYFGNPVGDVTTGPFAGWVAENGRLNRDLGRRGRLISKENVAHILTKCYLREISRFTSTERTDAWEFWHDGVHVFVGGDMASYFSPYDPIFYFHHAFIDKVWEQFRERQRNISTCGVDPTTDYPDATGGHGRDEPMDGYPFLRNIDGCSDVWTTSWYNYEPSPACPSCTRNNMTYCSRSRGVCIARRTRTIPPSQSGRPRSRAEIQADATTFYALLAAQEATLVPQPGTNVFSGPHSDGRTPQTVASDLARAEARGLNEEVDAISPPTRPRGLSRMPPFMDLRGVSRGRRGGRRDRGRDRKFLPRGRDLTRFDRITPRGRRLIRDGGFTRRDTGLTQRDRGFTPVDRFRDFGGMRF